MLKSNKMAVFCSSAAENPGHSDMICPPIYQPTHDLSLRKTDLTLNNFGFYFQKIFKNIKKGYNDKIF